MDKVELHMDKASSHMSKSSVIYLATETEIKYTLFNEIPVKYSDASLIDFCVFDLLNRVLKEQHLRILKGQ